MVNMNVDELKAEVPRLESWNYLETRGEELVAFLSTLANEAETLQQQHLQRLQEQQPKPEYNPYNDDGTLKPYTEEDNDRLCRLVAHRRQAIRDGKAYQL